MRTLEQDTRIRDIKQELADTDFHIIKVQELIIINEPIPERYYAIIEHRMDLRRELNEIEKEIS